MSYDMFLSIDGIKGDSFDSAHKDWIEISAYSHKISQPSGGVTSAQGSHSGGRADHQDFTLNKRLDSASPILGKYVCDGKHIPNIRFELCRAMGDKTIFMVYVFKDSIVGSIAQSGASSSDDPLPNEEITVRYGEIDWTYTPTDITSGGKKGADVKAGWSTLLNKPI